MRLWLSRRSRGVEVIDSSRRGAKACFSLVIIEVSILRKREHDTLELGLVSVVIVVLAAALGLALLLLEVAHHDLRERGG